MVGPLVDWRVHTSRPTWLIAPETLLPIWATAPEILSRRPVTSISTCWIASGRAVAPVELSRVSKQESCH